MKTYILLTYNNDIIFNHMIYCGT